MRGHLRNLALGAVMTLAGCARPGQSGESAFDRGVAGSFQPPATAVASAPAFRLEGSVRVGSGLLSDNAAGLVSNNAGGLVGNNANGLVGNNANGLSGGKPLSNGAPLAGVTEVSAGSRIAPVAALSSAVPVTQLGMAGDYRVQAASAAVVVEIVDPATGELLRRARADAQGHYRFDLPEPLDDRGWIVQATEVAAATVSAFLAAPVPARSSRSEKVDVTPASTVVVFSAALLSGVRGEFRVDTGFRGVKTQQLAAMVAKVDGAAVKEAAAKMDGTAGLSDAMAFDTVLDNVVGSSVALAKASEKIAADSGQKLAHVVAAGNGILREIGKQDVATGSDPVAVVKAQAAKVETATVAAEASSLVEGTEDSLLTTPVVTGTLE